MKPLLLVLAAATAFAHHSFMAEFDQRQAVVLQGVVTKVNWMNPHTYFYMDVTDQTGNVQKWILETGSPSALISRGWSRDMMKVGDHITVHAYRAKEQADLAAARSVTFPDGRTLFGGQTDDAGPLQ